MSTYELNKYAFSITDQLPQECNDAVWLNGFDANGWYLVAETASGTYRVDPSHTMPWKWVKVEGSR